MISAASNIKSVTEELRKMPIRHLYDALRNPSDATKSLLRSLRIIRQLDATQYAALKQQLPYFVCAMFNPPYRRTENFAYTEYFIIDIDHLSDRQLVVSDVRAALVADPRTMLCFVSPGGDGLKVVFRLSERCYDAGLYKTFYKQFLHKLSCQYGLGQVIDSKTCDVTRACFLSADADAYFNPTPEPVAMSDYICPDSDATLAFDIKRDVEQIEREMRSAAKAEPTPEPGKDIMEHIRETLKMTRGSGRCKPEAYVPQEVNDLMADLQAYIEAQGVVITETRSIQYGKKLHFKIGNRQAEINLFYGRRGFTVVQSPRTGTDREANALMADLVEGFIFTHIS